MYGTAIEFELNLNSRAIRLEILGRRCRALCCTVKCDVKRVVLSYYGGNKNRGCEPSIFIAIKQLSVIS
jgi:hypothetical protein